MEVFRLNVPAYFSPSELAALSEYLDQERELYYVIEENELVVGAGGINFEEGKRIAIISWDMVHPEQQGKGLGRQLLNHRLAEIKKINAVEKIIVRTAQLTFEFYKKSGFKLLDIKMDYWAEGFDLYYMEMIL